jgi:transcriptional regulator with XRE-family HTH domain
VNTLVNTLKAWREKHLLSQEKAAKLLGVTRPYLNQIENGRKPGAEFVNKFRQLSAENRRSESDPTRVKEDEGIYGPRSLLRQRRTELGLSLQDVAVKAG